MRKTKYERIYYVEDDDRWVGELAEGWMTEDETITVFADSKKELMEKQKYFIKYNL